MEHRQGLETPDSWSHRLANLADADLVEQVAEAFESSWQSGQRPRIEDFLSGGETSKRLIAIELCHIELEYRLKAGEDARADEYFSRFRADFADPATRSELIQAEFHYRSRRQRTELVEDLRRRFPDVSLHADADDHETLYAHGGPPDSMGAGPALDTTRFELIEQVGRGAFSVVWKAYDRHLHRLVALKILNSSSSPHSDEMRQLLREARSLARLHHPNIVPLFDAGDRSGQGILVHGFVDGTTLGQQIAEGSTTPGEAAQLVETVAEALHYAHQQGVIHRDLKPSNILLDRERRPLLADFGLARCEESESVVSREGWMIGTLPYMAPEQVAGQPHRGDAQTDVYSLGVILYELLTGIRPFRGDQATVLKQVLEFDPPSPLTLHRGIPRDLATICLKAMAKERRLRYGSAAELADDLARFRRREPIHARPLPLHGRVWRWAQRRPVVAALATSICLVTASGLIAVVWFGSSAASHRRQAETNLRQTQEAVRIFTEAIDEQLQGVPDSQAARVSLLQTGLRYYEHFVRQQSDDPALQAELAHAHERIGSIQHEIGSATAALDSHRRALELRRRLAQQSPDDFKRKRHLAHSIYEVASLLKERGELAEALTLHREAAHLRQQLCEQTGELESHRELVWSQLCIGQLLADTENNEAAQQCYQDARNRLVELGSRFRDDEKIQTDLAVVLNRLGLLRREMNDSSGAVEFHREALARLLPMHESHEQSSGLARELAATYHYLGLLRREAEPDQALADFMNGLKLREAIVSREPNVARYEADLATSYTYVGQHYLRAGKGDDAFGYYERASDIHARHVQLDSTNVRSRMRLGQSWQGMAEGCVLMRDLDRALRCLAQATGVWRTLVEQFPEERLYRETLADHWCRIGQLQFERKEYSSALQTLENGRGEYLHLLSKFPAQKKSLEPKLNGASGFIAITRERLE